jgi:hypothetical protein
MHGGFHRPARSDWPKFQQASELCQKLRTFSNFQNQLEGTRKRKAPITAEELQRIEERGNKRKNIRPNHAPTYKVKIMHSQNQWEKFAIFRGGCGWKELIQ